MTLRVGLLVNPIAGIGGPAAWKGSDDHWRDALAAGIEPQAGIRAARFVAAVGDTVAWLTVPGAMGVPDLETIAMPISALGQTSAQDTIQAAQALRDNGVDLLCFVGGDGTATDVAQAVGTTVPCLGIPAGVKITSSVFTHDVEEAAWLVATLADQFDCVERDVTDLDEAAYREGRLDTKLTGSLRVPLHPGIQGGKVATTRDAPLDGLADMMLRDWDPEAIHLIGAGSVCMAIKKRFYGKPTLLGLDAIQGDRIIATDLDAGQVDALVKRCADDGTPIAIVLSTIGGQGMLLGRGTQVIPATIWPRIGWDALRIAAPAEKLQGLPGLWIDSGDLAVDESAPKYAKVVAGWNETRMVRLLHGASR